MDIEIQDLPQGVTLITLAGRLDAAGAERIGLRFTAAASAQGRPAVVDFGGVDFVASMGLRLIISTAKSMEARGLPFVLFGARPEVAEVFEMSALDQLVDIRADRDAALATFPG